MDPKANRRAWPGLCTEVALSREQPQSQSAFISLSSLTSPRGSESFSSRPPTPNGRRPKGTLFTVRACYSGSAVSKRLAFQKKVSVLLESPLPPLKIADALRGPRIITAPPTTPKMTNLEMQFAEV